MPYPDDDVLAYSEEELITEFVFLFPMGWAGADVQQELAPDGWGNSPLVATYHPSAEQVHEETVRMMRNIASLDRKPNAPPPPLKPTLEETIAEYQASPVEPDRECRELVGQCLWDIFSDNHNVMAADGRQLDLGSMRSGGGFLAEVLNKQTNSTEYDYINFYMGTIWLSGRADLVPVYRMIFRRMHARGLDWIYHFPRIYAVDMRPLKKTLNEQKGKPEWEDYDPSKAFEAEQEDQKRDKELAEFRASLDEGHRKAVEAARELPPPATVVAYREVSGRFPTGWPPEA